MYVIIALKDVIKRIIMLYYCNYFSFLTEEKYWSTKTKLNDKRFIAVHIFLIFSNVIISSRAC